MGNWLTYINLETIVVCVIIIIASVYLKYVVCAYSQTQQIHQV